MQAIRPNSKRISWGGADGGRAALRGQASCRPASYLAVAHVHNRHALLIPGTQRARRAGIVCARHFVMRVRLQ
jgi:hypothetical protein